MFARVFIDRPVLAWVISIVIVLFGLAALAVLPIAQYPEIAPPTIQVTCNYPGANAQVVANTVAAPIESQVNGVEKMLYMSSTCGNDGSYSLMVTFELGTNLNDAQVLVQNRVSLALPQLPPEIQRTGLSLRKRSSDILLVASFYSKDNSRDQLYLSNFATIQVRDALARVSGVGDVIVFGQQDYSMRAWLDPDLLAAHNLTVPDVVKAIREQNVQVAAGQLGQEPALPGQAFQYTLSTLGRLEDVEQFKNIIVKVGAAGAAGAAAGGAGMIATPPLAGVDMTTRPVVRLKDVARVELTARSRDINNYMDGMPGVGVAVFQLPGSNALDTADRAKAVLRQMEKRFPPGVNMAVHYDTTPYIRQSVDEVFVTLIDAVILVAAVVLLFLQDWRAMILPMIDVPVSLIGTLAVLYAFGFSLNNLTLFGLVLAIGIVVDDAIVVLENVERWIAQGYDARSATLKAMQEITGPVVAITLVLSSVFLPSAFLGGVTGQFYRQFALTISSAMMISAVNALTLTPSRAAMIFKGHEAGKHVTETLPRWGWGVLLGWAGFRLADAVFGPLPFVPAGAPTYPAGDYEAMARGYAEYVGRHLPYFLPGIIVGWLLGPTFNWLLRFVYRGFNWLFDKATLGYRRSVGWLLRLCLIVLLLYGGLLYLTYRGFTETPTGYIPSQDKGYLLVSIQLPDAASAQRTREVLENVDRITRSIPGVSHTVTIGGMSFVLGANGPNFGTMFVLLDDFEKRKNDPQQNGFVILAKMTAKLRQQVRDAQIVAFPPPPVSGLGTAGGYRVMVEDRGDLGPEGLQQQVVALIAEIRKDPNAGTAFSVFRANIPQLYVDIDRTKAKQLGIPLDDIFTTLQANLGGLYVNDFNRFGRNWQVNIQAAAPFRMSAETIRNLKVRNDRGEMVSLGTVATIENITGPLVIQRYNTFPAASVNGNLPPGVSTGEGIAAVDRAFDRVRSPQAAIEWTELFYLQTLEGSKAIFAFIGAVILVYLVLAALYDSWSLPLTIILVVPMCLLSSVAGVWLFSLSGYVSAAPEVNIFTQVGFIVLVGLASKNAILVVEFAEQRRKAGMPLRAATLEAVQLRLRPIVMTSFAFILGVLPLVWAVGAGAEMRQTLGIAVFSGMLGVTLFGVFLTPVFYYVIEWTVSRRKRARHDDHKPVLPGQEVALVPVNGEVAVETVPDGQPVPAAAKPAAS
ncbi:MAG TPA: efflux RND transporter permease subunit [Fimbriiglobus sp.]|nr:efflux RND transporter permease subunit [Fimbriiglobus sp.]